MAIALLRTQLTSLYDADHPLLKDIAYESLDCALKNLDELIDLQEIKTQVVQQIQLFLLNRFRPHTTHPLDEHMLHTIIAGPPGCGKTTLALVLAKIWGALGIIERSPGVEEITVAQVLREREADQSWYEYILYRQSQILREIRHQVFQLNPRRRSDPGNAYVLWQKTLKSIQEVRSLTRETLRESKGPAPESTSLKITIARREDLVAEYVGQTAPKTKKVLDDARGGVLFIDEAYSLCIKANGTKDSFGEECLTVINEFMSLYPRELIVIFAGYEDKLEGLFHVQPGLRRRFAHYFRIPPYPPGPLARIFRQQLQKKGWVVPPDVPVEQLLTAHSILMTDGGGSTEKLALLCKLAYAHLQWTHIVAHGGYDAPGVISTEVLTHALRSWHTTPQPVEHLSMFS